MAGAAVPRGTARDGYRGEAVVRSSRLEPTENDPESEESLKDMAMKPDEEVMGGGSE
ncbi:hypothetical protein ACFWUU_38150 [Kribbella sp. NPDC058693]|uniref:hypothetical protein n=1 Tax=Kribbella sp. NPDC058693 TaxID=3346602 RepID=UPI00364C1EF9